MKRIWRKAIGYQSYTCHAKLGSSVMLYLECGHIQGRKLSQGSPDKVVCRSCEMGVSRDFSEMEAIIINKEVKHGQEEKVKRRGSSRKD